MRGQRKLLLIITFLIIAIFAMPAQASAKVAISKKNVTITQGSTTKLKITGTKEKVTWSSSNKKIVTVSTQGVVTGKKTGSATITAKVSGKKYSCKVTVTTTTTSMTAQQIVKALKKKMNIYKISTPTTEGTTGEPNSYTSKVVFYDKKYNSVYCTVEVFEDCYDAAQRYSYIQTLSAFAGAFGLTEDTPLVPFRYKNVILRVNTSMPESYAKKYYTALKQVVK